MLSPETTADREGFLHPYVIEGGVGEVKIRFLLRDFDTPKLAEHAELLREVGRQIEREYPEAKVEVDVTQQYRNMRDGIAKEPRAIAYAEEATRRAGLEPKFKIIRGGTDGAMLTEKGLPTPNLSTGEHNLHSPLEWTCLEEMEAAVRVWSSCAGVGGEVIALSGSPPTCLPTSLNAAMARSICSSVCAADTWMRMRAWPCGTTGKLNPIT